MPTRAKKPRAETALKRERILEETLRIVSERGYHGFGIQELAERCGLTKPGLLHHFGSKDQLLITLLNEVEGRKEAELAGAFAAAFEEAPTHEAHIETLRRALTKLVEMNLREPQLIRLRVVLRAEAINPDHPAHDYMVEHNAAMLKRLERATQAFSADPKAKARQLVAMMRGLEELWLSSQGDFDLAKEWTALLELLIACEPQISPAPRPSLAV